MKIFDERGVTLYELLATLVISVIVLPVIYGVFSSGVNLYNKIQVEGQFRDDADYTATMIMNTFYSFPFDYVRKCGDNCIELVDNTQTSITKDNNENQTFYRIDQDHKKAEASVKLELDEIKKVFLIDGKSIDTVSDFSNSSITLSCDGCGEGMITLDFKLDDKRLKKPLELKSQFGF